MTGGLGFPARQARLERDIAEVPGGDFSRPNIGFALSGKIREGESAAVDFNQRAHNSPELFLLEQFEQVDLGDFYAALIHRRVSGYVRLEVTRYKTIRHGQRKIPFQGREWSVQIRRPRNIGFDRPLRNKMRYIRRSQFID